MRLPILLLFLSFSILCNGQKKKLNYPKIYEDIESDYLTDFLTTNIKVDSTTRMQFAWIFFKVSKKGKVEYLQTAGTLEEKYKKILEGNIYKKNTPWLSINKKKYLWYILPIVFGQIPNETNLSEMHWNILHNEHSMNMLRDLIRENPTNIFILRVKKKLTNKGMEEIGM